MCPVTARPFAASMLAENLRSFVYNIKPSVGNWPGIRTAPLGAEVVRNKCLWASTTLGANKLYECSEHYGLQPSDGRKTIWQRPFLFKQVQNALTTDLGGALGECVQGIEFGSFGVGIPWQTNFVAANEGPVIQLRYNFTLVRWEVLVWDFDVGTAPDIVPCTVQPFGFLPDQGFPELMIVYKPGPGGVGSAFLAYLNGILVHTYQGARLDNCYNGAFAEMSGAGFFAASGSSATNRVIEAGFYRNMIYTPDNYM